MKNLNNVQGTTNNVVMESIATAESQGYSYANMNKAFREILTKTQTLNQAVKTFGGLMNVAITVGNDTRTIREWLTIAGVQFDKDGKLTAKNVLQAWPFQSEDGKTQFMYRNVPGCIADRTAEKPTMIPVYTFNGAKWNKVCLMKQVHVTKWSADVILKGLLQGAFPERLAKQVQKSADAWADVKEIFIFAKRNDKGGVNNIAIETAKDKVEF